MADEVAEGVGLLDPSRCNAPATDENDNGWLECGVSLTSICGRDDEPDPLVPGEAGATGPSV